MRRFLMALTAVGLAVAIAAPAWADAQPSARDIQAAVDSYLADSNQDVNLVGGPGSAGYDNGFWIKGGDFSLKINLTLQARFEAWMWDDSQKGFNPAPPAVLWPAPAVPGGVRTSPLTGGGTTSGFSLPRATLKFSGTAPCSISYYMELEFGHFGQDAVWGAGAAGGAGLLPAVPVAAVPLGVWNQSRNFDSTREAWIQWSMSDVFNFRMGQIKTATTRQAMVAPEMQQFVDVSLATAALGQTMPGYTDRNRDHGFAIHGAFGCNKEFSYLLTVTNGDGGDSIRNVLDQRTSDNVAFSARLNWAFLNPIGYQEGALRQQTCEWYGEVGVWGYYYADRVDATGAALPPIGNGEVTRQQTDALRWGVDVAAGYGGFSFTAAFSMTSDERDANPVPPAAAPLVGTPDMDSTAILVQLGYHFPGTAWEIAARWSMYDVDNPGQTAIAAGPPPFPGAGGAPVIPLSASPWNNVAGGLGGVDGGVSEFAFAVNYYLNGHGNKLTIDVAFVGGDEDPVAQTAIVAGSAGSVLIMDPYAGYPGWRLNTMGLGDDTYGVLLRFQWQLAL